MICSAFALWLLCSIRCLCLHLMFYDSSFPPYLLSPSPGVQRICLIILNQPLDKDYLHILWSKGRYFTHHQHRSAQLTCIPSALVYTKHVFPCCVVVRLCSLAAVASTVQNLNCCHDTECPPFLTSAHISCEICFNEVKDDVIVLEKIYLLTSLAAWPEQILYWKQK